MTIAEFNKNGGSMIMSGNSDKIGICAECGSEYLKSTSEMLALCPECAHILYGYENCQHVFKDGKCMKCLWNGRHSDYVQHLLNDEN